MQRPRELAVAAADGALKSAVGKLFGTLSTCIATADDDPAIQECVRTHTNGLEHVQRVHVISRAAIDEVFPNGD